MKRNDSGRAAAPCSAAERTRAFRLRLSGLLLSACAGLLPGGCHPGEAPVEEKYVTVRLHDSLSRYARVEVLILVADDTSRVVGEVWDGPLREPDSLPAFRLSGDETRPLAIRVRAYDSSGALLHDNLLSKEGGRQVVIGLLPSGTSGPSGPSGPSVPGPSPARPSPSVRLSRLEVFPGTLQPPFDSLRRDYRVSLPYEHGSLALTATAATDSAVILIEGVPAASGVAGEPFDLQVGSNELGIRVTVGDSTVLYSLQADRARRADSPDTLLPSGWSPAFRAWKYKADVEVNVLQLGLGQGKRVEDFPLLIRLDRESFDFTRAATGGKDLRITRLGRTLPMEIARWDSASGRGEVWVKLDTVRGDTAFAPLTLYWGNPAADAVSDPAAVFPPAAGHAGVWHLEEYGRGKAGEYRDATGRHHGRSNVEPFHPAVPRRVEGVAGFGQSFKFGSAHGAIELPESFGSGAGWQWTFQCWVKTESSSRAVLFSLEATPAAPEAGFQIVLDGPGQQLGLYRKGDSVGSKVYLPRNNFVHLAIVHDGNLPKVYVDGTVRGLLTDWSQGSGAVAGAVLGAANRAATLHPFDGVLDELWFASGTRSAEWLRLAYENQKPFAYLVAVGKAAVQKTP